MMTTSKITKWGNSHAIRFPQEILAQANLEIDDMISIDILNGHIILTFPTSEAGGMSI